MKLLIELLIGVLLLSGLLGGRIHAQAVQPTGQAAPETGNPQTQPAQNLGASRGFLQGDTDSKGLGASLNQLAIGQIQVEDNEPPNTAGNDVYYDSLGRSPDELSSSGFNLTPEIVIAIGVSTALLSALVIYLASRHKLIDPL